MEYEFSDRSGQYCPDCGQKHVSCICPHRGNTLPAIPAPKFDIGGVVYRAKQGQGPKKVLDRILCMWHEAEWDDGGYDGGHSAISSWHIEWRYKVTCHWKEWTTYDEHDLWTRIDEVPWVVWYYGPFSGMPGIEHVKKCIPDITEDEYVTTLQELDQCIRDKVRGLMANNKFPFVTVR